MDKELNETASSGNSDNDNGLPKMSRKQRRKYEEQRKELVKYIRKMVVQYIAFAMTHDEEANAVHLKFLNNKYHEFINQRKYDLKHAGNLFLQEVSRTIQNNMDFREDLKNRDEEARDILNSLKG